MLHFRHTNVRTAKLKAGAHKKYIAVNLTLSNLGFRLRCFTPLPFEYSRVGFLPPRGSRMCCENSAYFASVGLRLPVLGS